MKLTPTGKRLVFPDGHIEDGYMVEFDEQDETIAALKAERDRAKEYAEAYFDETKILKEENDKLRAALEEIAKLRFDDTLRSIEIARRALVTK
jgi:hypothetical protein